VAGGLDMSYPPGAFVPGRGTAAVPQEDQPFIAPTPLPEEWTFWADEAVPSGGPGTWTPHAPLGPIQCAGFTCNWVLNNHGNGSAIIPVEQGGFDRNRLLQFYGWRFWAFYKGQPVWAGLPIGLRDDGGAAVEVSFTELIGYTWRKQYATWNNYVQREQMWILGQLQARLENIGVSYRSTRTQDVLRDRNYAYLEGSSRGELMENLAGVIGGPEFRGGFGMSSATGRPEAWLEAGYPRVGSDTGLGLTIPGEGVEFDLTWSSEMQRTRTFAVGELPENAAANARKPVVLVYGGPGYRVPMFDYVDDYPGVVLRSTLQERANTNSVIYAQPTLELHATVSVSSPPLGSYGVGDTFTVDLTDPLLPGGYLVPGRLSELNVDAAAGTAEWQLAIAQPPPKAMTALTARLDRGRAQTAQQFHRMLELPPPGTEE
jgi:hypothetical protein